jgi:CBS domain-containing protein
MPLRLVNGRDAPRRVNHGLPARLYHSPQETFMNIGSICSRRIVTIDSKATLAQAAAQMRDRHVGALVVTAASPEGLRVTGVVTDRDLVIHVLAQSVDGSEFAIADLANRRIASVSEKDDTSLALDVMREFGVRRLLVTGDDQQLVGIVSLDDLAAACASDMDRLARVIRSGLEREAAYSAPATPPAPVLRIPAMGTAGWGTAMA